jgi:ureidoglycolate hydrolase
MSMRIRARHATAKIFSAYGRVVGMPKVRPTSQAADYKFWSDIADYAIVGSTEIGICTVYKQRKTEILGMERHLRTPEILIPIDAPFVLPLLLDREPETQAKAFQVNPGEAVVIDRAVWHGACLPVGKRQSSYFVIFRKNTPHEDVEKKHVQPFEITL